MNGLHFPLFAGSIYGIMSKARVPVTGDETTLAGRSFQQKKQCEPSWLAGLNNGMEVPGKVGWGQIIVTGASLMKSDSPVQCGGVREGGYLVQIPSMSSLIGCAFGQVT